MIAPALLAQGAKAHDLGSIAEFPQGEFVLATFISDPAQGAVSRRVVYIRGNGLVAGEPSFTILYGRSSYLGCPVAPNGLVLSQDEKRYKDVTLLPTVPTGFGSSCHPLPGIQYDREGNQTAGLSARALDRYAFSIRNGHLFIGEPYSVSHVTGTGARAKIYESPLALPGEPVSGIESWLYLIRPPS